MQSWIKEKPLYQYLRSPILNLTGKTIYKVGTELFELNPGDLLVIPEGTIHKAMGLTPRITLSYALYS